MLVILTTLGVILVSVAQYIGSIIALLFGRRLTWLWVALAVFGFVSRIVIVGLYRETILIRAFSMLAGGVLAAVIAVILNRRFPKAFLAIGGFVASASTAIQLFGPLLNPFPEWVVMSALAIAGVVGSYWILRNPDLAGVVLSAFIGASMLTSNLMNNLDLPESSRFQVLMAITLIGISFQLWRERRAKAKEEPALKGGQAA